MFLFILLALPLALTVVAALIAAVPVYRMSHDAVADLERRVVRVQPSLVALEVLLVLFYRPSDSSLCGHTGVLADLIPWIGLCSMLVGGVVVAASSILGSRRRLLVVAVVLSYVAGFAFLAQIGPCQN
jgi:hypothetical membrane protein